MLALHLLDDLLGKLPIHPEDPACALDARLSDGVATGGCQRAALNEEVLGASKHLQAVARGAHRVAPANGGRAPLPVHRTGMLAMDEGLAMLEQPQVQLV